VVVAQEMEVVVQKMEARVEKVGGRWVGEVRVGEQEVEGMGREVRDWEREVGRGRVEQQTQQPA
jgi:hypothetical protein